MSLVLTQGVYYLMNKLLKETVQNIRVYLPLQAPLTTRYMEANDTPAASVTAIVELLAKCSCRANLCAEKWLKSHLKVF